MHSKEAHTAEHVFMGCLQQQTDGLSVRKVEHKEEINRVYLSGSKLTLDMIYEAEIMTNKIIQENRKVKEHGFQTLDEAHRAFPEMRAYEERITGGVRVVEIDGFDYAACAREHAQLTGECEFFLVTRITKERDEYEVDFLVGEEARRAALELSILCIKTARELGASIKTLEATARNMKAELESSKERMIFLTEGFIDMLRPETYDDKTIYAYMTKMLDDSTIMKKSGELIKQKDTIVLFVNTNSHANVLLACNRDLKLNCNEVLRSVLTKFGGKGGGRPNFASGSVEKENVEKVFDELRKELNC